MKELGITKGEWEAVPTEKVENHLDIAINSDGDCIAWVYSDSSITNKEEECLANAKLIADAGTTANKCGMLPSELLERYNEAIAVMSMIRSNNLRFGIDSSKRRVLRLDDEEWGLLEQTISKANRE